MSTRVFYLKIVAASEIIRINRKKRQTEIFQFSSYSVKFKAGFGITRSFPGGSDLNLASGNHRVERVLGIFSTRPNWDAPSHPQASVSPPLVPGGNTLAWVEGVGGPNSDVGTDTVVLVVHCNYRFTRSPFLFQSAGWYSKHRTYNFYKYAQRT